MQPPITLAGCLFFFWLGLGEGKEVASGGGIAARLAFAFYLFGAA